MPSTLFDEDWEVIVRLLPTRWEQAAVEYKALQRAREVSSPEVLLRLILLHVATGLSLRQTSVRARMLGLANISDVALLKRLRAAEPWLRGLCQELAGRSVDKVTLFSEQFGDRRLRAIDATTVQEPGASGTSWRLHFSLCLPSLSCDFFELTDARGAETYGRFPAQRGDILLADRGYSHRKGVASLIQQEADYVVRLVAQNYPLLHTSGQKFQALSEFQKLNAQPGEWRVEFEVAGRRYPARLCAIRKSAVATERARVKAARKSVHDGLNPDPESLALAEFVYVLTSLPEEAFSTATILEMYRMRWQIELVFKRFKSLLGLGHLPKYDERSCRAWLHAKMLCALLIEELTRSARLFSPWGYPLRGN
jgi:hypothetical protein